MLTAILVDGGFYRKRARTLWGEKASTDRAEELQQYCNFHIKESKDHPHPYLYRIFYYDCEPAQGNAYHPLLKKNISLSKNPVSKWTLEFFNELKRKRKFALRLGLLSQSKEYTLKPDVMRDVVTGKREISSLSENDFRLNIEQKGVDMKIGLDISSLAYKKQVQQIILISGDSDFVPAAKLARREGIDVILDPMKMGITNELYEHIDGLRSFTDKITSSSQSQN